MNSLQADKIGNYVIWGYLTAMVLLLSSYILTIYSTKELLHESGHVSETNLIINELDNILAATKGAESSLRGYMVMKDEEFLRDYYQNPRLVASSMEILRKLSGDDDLKQARLDSLNALVVKKFSLLTFGLDLFRKNYLMSDSVKAAGYRGMQLMAEINAYVDKIKLLEVGKMGTRSQQITSFSETIKYINIISIIVAILLTFSSIITYNKESVARRESDKQARVFHDQLEMRITELDKMNTELLELKSIEKFAVTGRIARTIAHEVRNPLTNINLATEHLKGEIQRNSDIDMLFELIARNTNRINQLINDLLNSTREAHMNFEKVNINDVVDSSLQLAMDRIELNHISVIKNYTEDICDLLVDEAKIKIAFLNVIVNAIEAMEPDRGILHITTENQTDRCVVTITDNGKGLEKDELTKLFEPYYTTKENGTGLGLTNTQNIILSHKGSITATSQPGEGTSFIITFYYPGEA